MENNEQSAHEDEKRYTIIVNGREKIVTERNLTFSQLVALAFETPPSSDNLILTVTYRNADGHKSDGTLTVSESVKIKLQGTIFNVTATNKS